MSSRKKRSRKGKGNRTPRDRRHRPAVRVPQRRALLDMVSLRSIGAGKKVRDEAAEIFTELDACWRRQIAEHWHEIQPAMVTAAVPFEFKRWQRIVQYRYSDAPLSCAGSVLSFAGGRFNHGGFDPINFPPFPALYLAEDQDTAWLERHGIARTGGDGGLSAEELLVRKRESVAYVSVSGVLDRVVDLRQPDRLDELITVVSRFEIPPDLIPRARDAFGTAPEFPNTRELLLERLLDKEWRGGPIVMGAPAGSQSFGHSVVTAGITGIVYPSTRANDGRCCLAAFPINFASNDSWIALDDPAPVGATHVRLDRDTYREFLA